MELSYTGMCEQERTTRNSLKLAFSVPQKDSVELLWNPAESSLYWKGKRSQMAEMKKPLQQARCDVVNTGAERVKLNYKVQLDYH